MRKFITIIICLLLLQVGVSMAAPANDNKKDQETEQKTEKKDEKKDDKKNDNNDDKKPHKPVFIVVYEFAWPWVTR